jgi:hypothetical protein
LAGHKFGDLGLPRYINLILAYIILANSDSISKKHNIHNKFSDFYFGEFLKIAKIGQNYILAKKNGYTVSEGSCTNDYVLPL